MNRIACTALVIGESLVDILCRPDTAVHVIPGGSPMNVAIGLRRLGMKVILQTRFGHDEFGQLIEGHLAADGVDLTEDSRQDQPTSVARASIGMDGVASYSFDIAWDTPGILERNDVEIVHVGSIAAMLEASPEDLRARLIDLRRSATISYDPNIRPALGIARGSAVRRVAEMVAVADVVKASVEDIAWLYPGRAARRVADDWLDAGPGLVIMTQGRDGAFAVTTAGSVHMPAPKVLVADTIGAGDSFMAGILAALTSVELVGRPQEQALRSVSVAMTRRVLEIATRCAAITVSRPGADLPTIGELCHVS